MQTLEEIKAEINRRIEENMALIPAAFVLNDDGSSISIGMAGSSEIVGNIFEKVNTAFQESEITE